MPPTWRRSSLAGVIVALGSIAAVAARSSAPSAEPALVVPNDNRRAAGTRIGDTVAIRLVVSQARWFPGPESGPSVVVDAFAEEGKAPQVPAPLIRVPAGTHIVATVRNALPDSTVTVHGLQTRPATTWDTVRVAPGETHTVRFIAGEPGTYSYFATIGHVMFPVTERETAGGAFVIDSAGARADDRVFVVNIWGNNPDPQTLTNALALNGKTWPYTERLSASLGDSVRYRIVNVSLRAHPMHLHGFYFRVDAQGSGLADSVYAPAKSRLAVTESVFPRGTMAIAWQPDRPGNWLLHCHLAFHVVPEVALLEAPPPERHDPLSHDPNRHMAGLIMGITVPPPPGWREPPRPDAQRLRLLVQQGTRRGAAPRAMGYVLHTGDGPRADSVQIPGPTLVLTRGRPADITVINRLTEPTGVHWHGIELESYSDGVAGWSGIGDRIAPPIAPGDSFVARLTQPRAGTFIYHTHLGDLEQLTSGLYGAVVVLEPGERFDPSRDHVIVAGWDGDVRPRRLLINGDSAPPPLVLARGQRHRLRFVNIGAAGFVRFSLKQGTTLVRWRAVAKDGADLPAVATVDGPSSVRINVGETFDAVFDATEPGEYEMAFDLTLRPGVPGASRRQRVIVR
jgi:FtsP/CotA-like multicopper oxidase with cupredoxin domain